jgi:hypothetical protein
MTRTDREALKRAIALAVEADPDRGKQLDAMIADEGFEYAGRLAASICQSRRLGLKPWQTPPCWASDDPTDERPGVGNAAAWRLRQRLLAAGLSVYEPDPIGALTALEARLPTA